MSNGLSNYFEAGMTAIDLRPIVKELRAILSTRRGELLRQEYRLIDAATNELEQAASLLKARSTGGGAWEKRPARSLMEL